MCYLSRMAKQTDDESKGGWVQTLGNRKLNQRFLTPEACGPIEEIAHALAGKFRFACQTEQRYSVAEHCVRGARVLPTAYAAAFLLHELSEVYLPDVSGPLKPYLLVRMPGGETISWCDLEQQHTNTLLFSLGLSPLESLIYSAPIKRMDWAMLAAEKRDLCGPEPEPWGLPSEPAPVRIDRVWDPAVAESMFLEMFHKLIDTGV